VGWLSRRRVPRILAILLVCLVLLLGIAGLGALVLPPLVQQVQELIAAVTAQARAPGGLDQAAEDLASRYGFGGYVESLREQARSLPGRLGEAAGPLLAVAGGVVGSVTALLSVLLLTFFLLLDNDRFIDAGLNLFNPAQRPRLRRLLAESAGAIHGYVNGNLAISLVAGVAAFIALTILGMPYAVALALIVALFDLVPLVGGILGAAIVVLVALFVDPVKAGILAVYFLVYQQVENNVLQPLVYGRSVKLHPLAIFLAVLAGGELLGILGALLAIPVAEIIRILAAEWLASRAKQTGGTVHGPHDDAPVEQVTADAAGPATDRSSRTPSEAGSNTL
jgi:predicted PurR-regulated permease PerM